MSIKELIEHVKRPDWDHLTQIEVIEILNTIDKILENSFWMDDYLNRNTKTVIDAIKKDDIPKFIKEKLLEKERIGKRRIEIINKLIGG